MASGINFKVYDPVTQLIASGGGSFTPNTKPGTSIINNSITNAQIAPGTITTNQIANNTILGSNISQNTITGGPTGNIGLNTITHDNIVQNTITGGLTGNIGLETITTDNILNGTITGTDIAPGTVTGGVGGNIAPGTITNTEIANNTITSGNIQDGTITGTDIASGTVTNTNLAPGPVNTIKGTNSLTLVDDFIIGTGLSLTAGPSPTLSASGVVANAGNTQFGLVQFDPSGDLTETAVNSGIANVKPLAITNAKVNPGAASTLKGTNSLSNVDDVIIGSGLLLSAGASPTISVTVPNAGNTQFGLVEFDPAGDLKQTSANSGIAVLKQPTAGNTVTNGGFDNTGTFVSSSVGAIVGQGVPNGTPLVFKNISLMMPNLGPDRCLQIAFVSGPGGYIAGGGYPIWDNGAADPPTPFVTSRFLYRTVPSAGVFVKLSERVAGEPVGSTLVTPAWDNSLATAPSTTGQGQIEVYNIYVNDSFDDASYRITTTFFNPNSYITVERMG